MGGGSDTTACLCVNLSFYSFELKKLLRFTISALLHVLQVITSNS